MKQSYFILFVIAILVMVLFSSFKKKPLFIDVVWHEAINPAYGTLRLTGENGEVYEFNGTKRNARLTDQKYYVQTYTANPYDCPLYANQYGPIPQLVTLPEHIFVDAFCE